LLRFHVLQEKHSSLSACWHRSRSLSANAPWTSKSALSDVESEQRTLLSL